MELDVKEQTEKVQGEIADIENQVKQVVAQENQLAKVKGDLLLQGLKKQGAIELLQSLNGDKPKEGD